MSVRDISSRHDSSCQLPSYRSNTARRCAKRNPGDGIWSRWIERVEKHAGVWIVLDRRQDAEAFRPRSANFASGDPTRRSGSDVYFACKERIATGERQDKTILCVLQGEVAAATPGDGPVGMGSDSATTCHIVALRHPATGRTCLAHLDDPRGVAEAIGRMLRLMYIGGGGKEGGVPGLRGRTERTSPDRAPAAEEPLDLYIVGGYLGNSCSQALSTALLSALHSSTRRFRVVLACMARLNSKRAGPTVSGLVGFEGEGRGPAWEVRSSRIFAGSREKALSEIYEPRSDSVVVSPFSVYVDPRWLFKMLVLTDRELLAQTSTSPEAEDERFVEDIRAQFSFIMAKCGAHGQGWLSNVFGPRQGEPLVFPRAAETAAAAAAVASATPSGTSPLR